MLCNQTVMRQCLVTGNYDNSLAHVQLCIVHCALMSMLKMSMPVVGSVRRMRSDPYVAQRGSYVSQRRRQEPEG